MAFAWAFIRCVTIVFVRLVRVRYAADGDDVDDTQHIRVAAGTVSLLCRLVQPWLIRTISHATTPPRQPVCLLVLLWEV